MSELSELTKVAGDLMGFFFNHLRKNLDKLGGVERLPASSEIVTSNKEKV